MPFQYILANLLATNDNAVGVLFLDDSGETVDLATSEFEPYDLKIVGAYLGIHLRKLHRMTEENEMGEPSMLHVEYESLHVMATTLPDGYSLILIQRSPAVIAQARRSLEAATRQMRAELFPG